MQLGATLPNGIPKELFTFGEARWLGVQAEGQVEQPSVLLLSVPYALKVADAKTIGGLPPSAFVLATSSASSARKYLLMSMMYGDKLGIFELSVTDKKCTPIAPNVVTFLPRLSSDGKSVLYTLSPVSNVVSATTRFGPEKNSGSATFISLNWGEPSAG